MIKQEYIYASSVKEIDASIWSTRWPSFSAGEVACKGTGEVFIYTAAIDRLQKLRDMIGLPLWINCGYRSPKHNKEVGGELNSQHIYGRAFDIKIRGGKWDVEAMAKAAVAVGFTGIGLYDTFIHVDFRPNGPARWDNRSVKNGKD